MLYNLRDSYTIDEMSTQLNFPCEQLAPVLHSLVKINLLQEDEGSTFHMNTQFTKLVFGGNFEKNFKIKF